MAAHREPAWLISVREDLAAEVERGEHEQDDQHETMALTVVWKGEHNE